MQTLGRIDVAQLRLVGYAVLKHCQHANHPFHQTFVCWKLEKPSKNGLYNGLLEILIVGRVAGNVRFRAYRFNAVQTGAVTWQRIRLSNAAGKTKGKN